MAWMDIGTFNLLDELGTLFSLQCYISMRLSITGMRSLRSEKQRYSTRSRHVSELRVPVSKMTNLLLAQPLKPVVALSSSPHFVLVLAVEDAEHCKTEHGHLSSEVDRVANMVLWSVTRSICPGSDDATDCSKSDDITAGNGTHCRTSRVCFDVSYHSSPFPSGDVMAEDLLFKAQARNPGPPGNAPIVTKKTAIYRISGSVSHLKIANPMTANSENPAK